MKAYGVFDGGGVKGTALAGCLAAAQDEKIEFQGYGGTSAGSIVALLAAVGYSGHELGGILVDLEFTELMDDEGACFLSVKREFERLHAASLICHPLLFRRVLGRLVSGHGLYQGDRLKSFLREQIKVRLAELMADEKLPDETRTSLSRLRDKEEPTFADLASAGRVPLKLVASDVTGRRTVVYSSGDTPGVSLLSAVRASAGYPFLFQPVVEGSQRLVDGGLCTNLPTFLFQREYRESRYPTVAFDLVASPKEQPEPYRLSSFVSDILSTALEASDDLLRGVIDGVVHVPIVIPPGIETLDVDVSRDDREKLFNSGYTQAAQFLTNYGPLTVAKQAGNRLKYELMARYGDPKLFQPVMKALSRDVQEISAAENLRAHIMLPTGRGTRIIVYDYGMSGDPDSDLELNEDAGCSGRAWSTRKPAVADLEEAARNPEPWKMRQEEHDKVPRNRKAMFSVPILRGRIGDSELPPAGTLSVDSTTGLRDTEWVRDGSVDDGVVSVLSHWAYVVARLLP